jgi:transposase InsO family protein
VFLPDVFGQLSSALHALTTTSDPGYRSRNTGEVLKQQINVLLQAAGPRAEIVRALIERAFPAAQHHIGGSHFGSDWKRQWLRDRRVAHEDIFGFYLERVVGEKLQTLADAEQAGRKWMMSPASPRFSAR